MFSRNYMKQFQQKGGLIEPKYYKNNNFDYDEEYDPSEYFYKMTNSNQNSDVQNVPSEKKYTLKEAKTVLNYDELVQINQDLQEHLTILLRQLNSKQDSDNLDTIEEHIANLAEVSNLAEEKILQYVEKKLQKSPMLKQQLNNEDFWRMIGDELNAIQRPFVKPDSIISSTESKRVADSIIQRAKRGEKISDLELGRAILNLKN